MSTTDSSQIIIEKALRKYTQIMASTDAALSAEEVKDLVAAARMHLATVLQLEISGQIEKKAAIEIRVGIRNDAKSMLNRSTFLESGAKRLLEELIFELPEYLSNEFRYTADYFSLNSEYWSCDLANFAHQPNLNFLEVGSFEGLSACWMLKNILTDGTSRLTCIDTFDFAGQGMTCLADVGSESMTIEERFDFNIERVGGQDKVRKIVGNSQMMLRTLAFSSYDYIYIDGSHKAVNVLEDGILSWPLLKKSGLLTFDDYEWEHDPDPLNCPKLAIDAFLAIYARDCRVIRKDRQVTIEKLSD